jgi:dipeptidyl aminopeptidase/acylaminoacyl peptidase
MEQIGPFTYALSDDGSKIAWARTAIYTDVDPPIYRNDLWAANIDGSGQVTLQEQVENTQKRFLQPVRFSSDNSELFYASQPDELGFDFSGRYDNIYSIPVVGGEPQLIFACQTAQNPICIGDITPDGSVLAYTQRDTGEVKVMNRDGNLLGSFTPLATDYVGSAVFGPTGKLAFVSATLSESGEDDVLPLPSPGYISLVEPPYSNEARILLTDGVITLWEWVDDNRLAYGSIDENGNVGTSIVTIDGQVIELSPTYALAVLR